MFTKAQIALTATRIIGVDAAFDAATLEHGARTVDLLGPYVPVAVIPTGKRDNSKSCKEWLRELLSAPGAAYDLKELVALTGKTEVNVRTMLSDLRNPKYAGKAGVFLTKSVRAAGVTKYSAA